MLLSRLGAAAFLLVVITAAFDPVLGEPREITVFAAGSLSDALKEIGARYLSSGGEAVKFTFGLSADFAKQIENGASGQIFVSASKPLVTNLARQGRVEESSIVSPIGNGLVLIALADSKLDKVEISSTVSLTAQLDANARLSTGDPDYVALGVYALEALTKLGQWKAIEPRLMKAASVQAALELVENGHAPLGIVFSTTAASSSKVKIVGRFPANSYTPIRYTFTILKGQNSVKTRKFFSFLIGPEARAIYAKYGFMSVN